MAVRFRGIVKKAHRRGLEPVSAIEIKGLIDERSDREAFCT